MNSLIALSLEPQQLKTRDLKFGGGGDIPNMF